VLVVAQEVAAVVTPLPVDTRCWSLPSAFMIKIWSHPYGGAWFER